MVSIVQWCSLLSRAPASSTHWPSHSAGLPGSCSWASLGFANWFLWLCQSRPVSFPSLLGSHHCFGGNSYIVVKRIFHELRCNVTRLLQSWCFIVINVTLSSFPVIEPACAVADKGQSQYWGRLNRKFLGDTSVKGTMGKTPIDCAEQQLRATVWDTVSQSSVYLCDSIQLFCSLVNQWCR